MSDQPRILTHLPTAIHPSTPAQPSLALHLLPHPHPYQADLLKTCETSFPDGCIIFLDELDALATTRSNDMHEATRRLLGVLLRHLDGFDTSRHTVVIGATNRKQVGGGGVLGGGLFWSPAVARHAGALRHCLQAAPCPVGLLEQESCPSFRCANCW